MKKYFIYTIMCFLYITLTATKYTTFFGKKQIVLTFEYNP